MKTNLSTSESIVVIDCVVFAFDEGELKILLKECPQDSENICWSLPVYTTESEEHIEEAAARALYQLTGFTDLFMEQFYTLASFDRQPPNRVISVAYYGLIRLNNTRELQRVVSYTRNVAWFSVDDLPECAFEQHVLIERVLQKIRRKVLHHPLALGLLPEKFTLTQLQNLYEVILQKKLDKRNFRKKALSYGILKDLNEKQKDVSYRAAKLFMFDRTRCKGEALDRDIIAVLTPDTVEEVL